MWFHITLTFYGERKKNRSGTENTTSTRSHTYIVQMLMYRDTAKKQNNNNIKKKMKKYLGSKNVDVPMKQLVLFNRVSLSFRNELIPFSKL